MINIDPKSWHARLYCWYMRSCHNKLQARALQGTYLCPYMRTLLIWIPLYITLALPLRFTVRGLCIFVIRPLYLLSWGHDDWHFRPRWIWLGLLIGAPLLVPSTWQYQGGWAWWSDVAWGFGFIYIMMVIASVVAVLLLLLVAGLAALIDLRGGTRGLYRDVKTMGGAVKITVSPVTKPTYGFARLLYKHAQTFHTKICPRVQFMEPEIWEEE